MWLSNIEGKWSKSKKDSTLKLIPSVFSFYFPFSERDVSIKMVRYVLCVYGERTLRVIGKVIVREKALPLCKRLTNLHFYFLCWNKIKIYGFLLPSFFINDDQLQVSMELVKRAGTGYSAPPETLMGSVEWIPRTRSLGRAECRLFNLVYMATDHCLNTILTRQNSSRKMTPFSPLLEPGQVHY